MARIPSRLLLLLLFAISLPARTEEEAIQRERVEALLADLASEDYETRRTAFRGLELMGRAALPWLLEASEHDDPEVALLAGRLVGKIRHRSREEILSLLDVRWNDFEKSEELDRLVARGRKLLPNLLRLLDEEDAADRPSYDRVRNAYAVIREIAIEDDRTALLSRLTSANTNHRYLVRRILEDFEPEPTSEEVLALLTDRETHFQVRANLLEIAMVAAFARHDERYDRLATRDLEDPDPVVRVSALRFLAFRRNPEALPAILAHCRDEDPAVRTEAFRALRSYPGPEAADALRVGLLDPDPKSRSASVDTLATAAGPELAPLIRPLLEDPDTLVRASAARALARIGDQVALVTLVGLLEERGEQFLIYTLGSVVDAVGRIGDRAALDPLFELLEDAEEYPRIASNRYAILRAIIRTGGEAVLPRIRPSLADDSLQNRHILLDTLAELESDEIVPLLMDALSKPGTLMRTSAIRGLTARDHREAAPLVLKAMEEEEDPWFLSQAVKALCRFRCAMSAPALRRLLDRDAADQRNTSLFYALFTAMVQFQVRDAAPRIAEIVTESESCRHLGVDALGRLGDPSVVPRLKELLEAVDRDSLRIRILFALARLGTTEPLLSWLANQAAPDPSVRIDALFALGRLEEAERLLREQMMRNRGNGNLLYNLACVHALKGETDKAFDLLEKAVALRPYRPEQLLSDPDLASLVDDPRFANLLEGCR